jgi:hypothetical protein
VREKGNQTKPTLRPHSTKAPEDSNKNRTKQKAVVEEETSDEEPKEEEEPPPPKTRNKKTVKIVNPAETETAVPEENNELPYSKVLALKSPAKTWKSPVPDKSKTPEPILIFSKKGPAYKTKAPIQSASGDSEMASRIMDTLLTVTAGDLLGVAPGVREEIKKSVTKRQMK